MRNAEKAGLTTTKPETTLEELLNDIGDSLSDFASSDDEDGGEDKDHEEEDPAGGKLSEDEEPGWVMGTISKMVQYRMEHCRQKQMKLEKLTQLGFGDAAHYFREMDKKYDTAKSNGSSCCSTSNGRRCSVICADDIWCAYGDSW